MYPAGPKSATSRPSQVGFTLAEVMIVVAIIAILVTLSVPGFANLFARGHLRAAGEQLRSDINLARSEAIKRNTVVRMSFNVSGNDWCYGIRANADCDCTVTDATNASYCFLDRDAGGTAIGIVTKSSAHPGITMDVTPFSAGSRLSFSPTRPALASGSATFNSSAAGASLRIVASGMGRVRFCSPASSLSGYPAC